METVSNLVNIVENRTSNNTDVIRINPDEVAISNGIAEIKNVKAIKCMQDCDASVLSSSGNRNGIPNGCSGIANSPVIYELSDNLVNSTPCDSNRQHLNNETISQITATDENSVVHRYPLVEVTVEPESNSASSNSSPSDQEYLMTQSYDEGNLRAPSTVTVRSVSVSSDIFSTVDIQVIPEIEYGAVSDSEVSSNHYWSGKKKLKPKPKRPVPFSVSSKNRFHSEALQKQRHTLPSRNVPVRVAALRQGGEVRAEGARVRVPSVQDEEEEESDEEVEPFSLRTMSRNKLMILLCLALIDLSSQMCLSIMAPFFPQEAARKGVSNSVSGWIFGVFALVQFLFSPFSAKLIPVVGSKFLICAGQFFGGGCIILFGALDSVDCDPEDGLDNPSYVILCFVLRICLALGCTASSTASFAVTANCFPEHVSTVFGILETAVGVGMMVGPAVGGVLFDYGGFILPFAVLGGFMLLCVLVCMYYLPEDEDLSDSSEPVTVWQIMRIPSVVIVSITVIVSALIWSVLDPTLAPHLDELDLSPTIIGLLFLLMAAFYAVCSPIWGWIADKMDNSLPMIAAGFLLTSVGLVLLGPSQFLPLPEKSLGLNIFSLAFLGLAMSLAIIPTFDKILDAVDKAGIDDSLEMYSHVAGIWGACYALGEFIGPSLGGILVDSTGFPSMVTYMGLACLILTIPIVLCWLIERFHLKSSKTNVEVPRKFSANDSPSERTPLLT